MSTVGTRWYTLAEAAPVLGVSVDTVRRRLKRGQIEGRQVHTQHGPTWEVCLGTGSTEHRAGAEDVAQGAAEGDAGAGLVQLVGLVDRLQQENRVLAGQVGFLTAQLAVAESKLALEAPESPLLASTTAASPDPTTGATWTRWRTSAPWVLLVVILLLALAVGQPAWVR